MVRGSAEVSPLPGVADLEKKTPGSRPQTGQFSFDPCEPPSGVLIAPTPGAETGLRDPSLVQDWREWLWPSHQRQVPRGGGVLILGEVEKMFCADPVG